MLVFNFSLYKLDLIKILSHVGG